jgi:hypothetical protein
LPNVLALTLAGVSVVSVSVAPVRALLYCRVRTCPLADTGHMQANAQTAATFAIAGAKTDRDLVIDGDLVIA